MTLSDQLITQINNPDCSYLVGGFMGGWIIAKLIFGIIIAYILLSAVDKLAYQPFLDWCKSKLFKKKVSK